MLSPSSNYFELAPTPTPDPAICTTPQGTVLAKNAQDYQSLDFQESNSKVF